MTSDYFKLERMNQDSLYYRDGDYAVHRGIDYVIGEVEKRMNELYDENEQLNQKHRQLQIDFNDLVGINTDYRELTYSLTDLIEDLGSEEMRRQMKQILNKSHISEFKCWAVKGE